MLVKLVLKLLIVGLALTACSESSVEEFTFRTLVESDLKDECNNDACKSAVGYQIKGCMALANWRELLGKDDVEDAEVFIEFNKVFRACFKDKFGEPLF